MHCSEEDTKILGGYHWDCSDWVRRSQNPLPNISEVPGSEVPDSSSFHSDSNDEVHHHIIGKFQLSYIECKPRQCQLMNTLMSLL